MERDGSMERDDLTERDDSMGRNNLAERDDSIGRDYFLVTERLGFSKWGRDVLELAKRLWGDPLVTRYICASGRFSEEEIAGRLKLEIANESRYGVQYWPVFLRKTGELVGCCGLRPHGEDGEYELGFHLRPDFWKQGLAQEAGTAVIGYAFETLHANRLFAGHNPNNTASAGVLKRLGFIYIGDEFYAPTGLYHPSYIRRA